MDASQQELNSEEYNIDNIIESAVDELLQQKVTSHSDYDDIDVLLLSLCRLCAREAPQLVKTSDVDWMLICCLKITGIDGSTSGTSICHSCMKSLEDIQQFRGLCEEGQKRIIAMLTQQNMLPDFLNLDFTDAKKEATMGLNSPEIKPQYQDEPTLDTIKEEQKKLPATEEKHKNPEEYKVPTGASSTRGHKNNLPRKAALKVQELVKTLASADSDLETSDSDEFRPEREQERHSTDESDQEIDQQNFTKNRKKKSKPTTDGSGKKSTSQKLESRRRMVDGRLEWVCLDCELVFESCFKLKKHRQNCELVGSERSKRYGTFPCETCGDVLNTFAALCLHRYKHETALAAGKDKKEKVEKICHVCGKIFKSARSLNKHLAIHSDEKKYVCQICDKSFAGKRYLRNHLDVHSDSKRHECVTCGKKFMTSISLRNHRETHKPNYLRQQCMICPKRFAHPYRLRKHMMVHTDEFPYSCEICLSVFRKACQLNRHMEKGHGPPQCTTVQPERLDEMVDFDDMIVYQPEDDLAAMFDTMKDDLPQLTQTGVIDTLPEEQPFATDHLLAEATREFTVQCFPEVHEADNEIYCFMEF
ncbi:zinc finger and BTB domain-containing protein 24-like [Anopheles ziemanni]|uniref:zinc finger and BTB domain-containing protein 24-like n=1 Tax=Anopheles coustani TaxID=139045 RepID=UPI002659C1C7|nr:zinc finger and BTB domain-containing protein 24-like [Anopheles coustani]XP_058174944.1 zinc finger and BTB domain-containing protein 24-like [Anopheles ziemanni]